jgi:transcriptional regulator with XRE-family HTH domain
LPKAWYVSARAPAFPLPKLRGGREFAKSTLSQLESGNGNPSLETLWALCVALDIPFARLLEPQVNTTQVIRRGEGTKVVAEQANYQAILLAACPPGARRDIYLLLTQPGADRISPPSAGFGGAYYCHPGAGAGRPDGSAGRAGEGDYICYPADRQHVFQALEPDTQALLIAEQNKFNNILRIYS